MVPDQKGEKLMGELRKRFRYDDTSKGEGSYNTMYEVEYPDGTTDQLESHIIAENILSQVDSEVHHYHLLTEVTYHNKDDSAIAKVGGFIK